jgi:hypothetical protein
MAIVYRQLVMCHRLSAIGYRQLAIDYRLLAIAWSLMLGALDLGRWNLELSA